MVDTKMQVRCQKKLLGWGRGKKEEWKKGEEDRRKKKKIEKNGMKETYPSKVREHQKQIAHTVWTKNNRWWWSVNRSNCSWRAQITATSNKTNMVSSSWPYETLSVRFVELDKKCRRDWNFLLKSFGCILISKTLFEAFEMHFIWPNTMMTFLKIVFRVESFSKEGGVLFPWLRSTSTLWYLFSTTVVNELYNERRCIRNESRHRSFILNVPGKLTPLKHSFTIHRVEGSRSVLRRITNHSISPFYFS